MKILFVTGFPGALFQAQPTLWEGQAFLEKPCTDRGLLEAISLLLTGTIAEGDSPPHSTVGSGCDADVEPLI